MRTLPALAIGAWIGFAMPQAGLADQTEKLNKFYDLLFTHGCKKHPDHIPGRNKHWLSQAGFSEVEYPKMIKELEMVGALIVEDGLIIGKIGVCA